jgi:hypothetical protein
MNHLRYILCDECHESVQVQDITLHQASHHNTTLQTKFDIMSEAKTTLNPSSSTSQEFPKLSHDKEEVSMKIKRAVRLTPETYHDILMGGSLSSLNPNKHHTKKVLSSKEFPSLPKAPSARRDNLTNAAAFTSDELPSSSSKDRSNLKKKDKKVLLRFG